jgi:hypothetical protein
VFLRCRYDAHKQQPEQGGNLARVKRYSLRGRE